MDLSTLHREFARKKRNRVGRGPGSGNGKTSGRGHKGQKARSGYSRRAGFEGGQMPLIRRMPKRGFFHYDRHELDMVNLDALEKHFQAGDEVDLAALKKAGLVDKGAEGVKVLARGELTKKLAVKANAFSETAKQKIEAAGGAAAVVDGAAVKAASSATTEG